MEYPSMYRISTITATSGVNTDLNLEVLFENINISTVEECHEDVYFTYVEYGKKKGNTFSRGFNKKRAKRKKPTEEKRFDNQATVIVSYNRYHTNYSANMKIFKNGNVQITGLKYIDQGIFIVEQLIEEIKRISKLNNSIVAELNELQVSNYCIRLINSDFRIGFEIKRDKLYRLLQTEYNIKCSYEPCIYPGVKIQYFKNNLYKHGCCQCEKACNGKGNGFGLNNCKKITIAVFQSGCVIITGAQSQSQIDNAYDFICTTIKQHEQEVKKVTFVPPSL